MNMFWRRPKPKGVIEVDYDAKNALVEAAKLFDVFHENRAHLSDLRLQGSGKLKKTVYEVRVKDKQIRVTHLPTELERLGKKWKIPAGLELADPLTYLTYIWQIRKKMRQEEAARLLTLCPHRTTYCYGVSGQLLELSSMITYGSEGRDGDPNYWPIEIYLEPTYERARVNFDKILVVPAEPGDIEYDTRFMRDVQIKV